MGRLLKVLSNVSDLAGDLFDRARRFMGQPVLKNLAIFGGVATLLTVFAGLAIASTNPVGVKVFMLIWSSVGWIIATRASWR